MQEAFGAPVRSRREQRNDVGLQHCSVLWGLEMPIVRSGMHARGSASPPSLPMLPSIWSESNDDVRCMEDRCWWGCTAKGSKDGRGGSEGRGAMGWGLIDGEGGRGELIGRFHVLK